MGALDVNLVEKIAPRPVPASAAEYAARRRQYRAEVSKLRKQFSSEWTARRERESTAMAAIVSESDRRAALRRARKDEHKALRAALRRQEASAHGKLRDTKRSITSRSQALWLAEVAQRRAAWLADLAADSANWIPEDRIDELITEDTFAEKYPWQYKEYFENAAARRLDAETRRRMHVHQLTSAAVAGVDGFQDAFADDWQSDATLDADDEEEEGLNVALASSLKRDLPASAGGAWAGDGGLRLEELYFGKPAAQLKADADAAMSEFMSPTASAGAGSSASASDAALDDVFALLAEDGDAAVSSSDAGRAAALDDDWAGDLLEDDPAWANAFGDSASSKKQ